MYNSICLRYDPGSNLHLERYIHWICDILCTKKGKPQIEAEMAHCDSVVKEEEMKAGMLLLKLLIAEKDKIADTGFN